MHRGTTTEYVIFICPDCGWQGIDEIFGGCHNDKAHPEDATAEPKWPHRELQPRRVVIADDPSTPEWDERMESEQRSIEFSMKLLKGAARGRSTT